MSCQRCDCCGTPVQPEVRRRPGIFGMLFQVVALYAFLVFGGGTLTNVDHPVASEVGELLHVVTFVEPTIDWARGHGYRPLATGLRKLADGAPIGPLV